LSGETSSELPPPQAASRLIIAAHPSIEVDLSFEADIMEQIEGTEGTRTKTHQRLYSSELPVPFSAGVQPAVRSDLPDMR
jgi:hypothetical protein